jgi:A/G-specific adenine glycosylase
MMLRRTRASQVSPVFQRFLVKYPSVEKLAAARPAAVAATLRPLGLEWRVPAFTRMAASIVSRFDGKIPREREALLSLPGVGDYVADAVRCFAYGEPVAVVDANTVRVAGRYFGFPTDPESRRRPSVRTAVSALISPTEPVKSNLAILDLAAAICIARVPRCNQCPVSDGCVWRAEHKLG